MVYEQDEYNPPTYQENAIDKTEQTKGKKIKEKIMNSNAHWNDWRFQFHWNKIGWVDQKTINIKRNTLCYSIHKFYIKYGKKVCNFVGH